jgi:ABC-type multidrug transport system fused ATPase/permease subunit
LEALTGIIIGCVIALVYNWKLALIAIAASPFMIMGALAMSKTQQRGALGGKGAEEKY